MLQPGASHRLVNSADRNPTAFSGPPAQRQGDLSSRQWRAVFLKREVIAGQGIGEVFAFKLYGQFAQAISGFQLRLGLTQP